jgi:hypothetical protein
MASLSQTQSAVQRRFDPFVRQFYRLAAVWRVETAHLSNLTQKCNHPAYRAIVAMGPDVIPLILAELEREPNHWFAALRELTGENPVPPEARGKVKEMASSWLDWAEKHGFHRETAADILESQSGNGRQEERADPKV